MESESVVSQLQRKIEIQFPEDLAYLLANVRNAARARIDEAFPPVDGALEGEDELRNQIEALIHEYINRTFSLAAPNISINGLPVPHDLVRPSESPESASVPAEDDASIAYEPFDTRKRQAIADLVAREEKLLEEVASLKRTVPANAAAMQATRVRDALQQDEDAFRQRVARLAAECGPAAAAGIRIDELERQATVEAAFRGAVETLERLKRDMPAVVAKMERARVAGEYVVTDGRR
ncbi:hypothetical protein DCS_04208 [Drechmeria coniospora]|uniref:Kinetochore protein mis14 n=1 Tax=Drechmeria coniospora TaxID=98403 RepID=A0A151GJJ1_DRECN|nr:hypothetical protein DCS_04208 [Drechmeria coniospora]KYK57201.1 hypothetical protein DCS_04208 [Drechmeria coniospora]ODA79108.1 hypothetical protein RJ55_04699 [Drechmeria coniospora]